MAQVLDARALNLGQAAQQEQDAFTGTADVDAFNMVISCHDAQFAGQQSAEQLKDRASLLSQVLAQHLFSLPVERSEVGALVHLDDHTSLVASGPNVALRPLNLPREKPPPQPKPETRWEKFRKMKGIQKVKKSRKVWDPETKTWTPRWGAPDAVNRSDREWVIEEKEYPNGQAPPPAEGSDPFGPDDPFTKKKAEKRKVIEDQKKRELRNIRAGVRAQAASTFTSASGHTEWDKSSGKKGEKGTKKKKSASSLEGGAILPGLTSAIMPGGSSVAQMSQARLSKAIRLAQKSTRSMGDHDTKRTDEPTIKKKRKRADVEIMEGKGGEKERSRSLKMADKVIKKTNDPMDVSRAVNQHIQQEDRKKRGRGKEPPSKRRKSK